jgi:hypothetical protein
MITENAYICKKYQHFSFTNNYFMKINYLPKKGNSSLFFAFFLLLTISLANAATRTSTATGGTWATAATWVGGIAPVAGDNVIIATTGANSVSLGANASITNVTINAGATLNILARTLTATGVFANDGTLTGTTGIVTLTGNFTNTGTVSLTTGQVNIATGNFSNTSTGSFTLTSTGRITTTTGSFSNAGTITYTLAGRLYLGGNYTNTGTFTLTNGGLVYFIGTANQSIQGFTCTGVVSMTKTGGTATLLGNVDAGGLTLSGLGGTLDLGIGLTHTFNGTWTRTNGTLNGGSSLFRIGLSASGTVATFNAGTGTVEYYRAGTQTVAPVTYNNLTLSGTSAKTITTATTIVNKVLSMEGTATATAPPTYNAASATLKYNILTTRTIGTEWVTPFAAAGGVVINGNQLTTINTAKVFNAGIPLTINSGAKLGTGASLSLTLGGDFINNGGTLTATSSPIIITNTMATQSIAGFSTGGLVSMTKTGGIATFTGNVSGAGLTINGTGGTLNLGAGLSHTFSGAVALTSGILNGGSSVLNANSTATAWSGTGTNFVAGTSTVNFGGVAQTLNTASTFNNLTFSNSGIKTLTGVPTVNGVLSMEGTATVSVAPTYGVAARLQYNRTAAQTASVEWITPFAATGGVFITNTGAITANAAKVFNASVPLNIDNGATLANGGFAITGTSTLTVSDGSTLQLSGTSAFPSFTTTVLDPNSTVEYNGTAQAVAIKSYGNLLLSNTGNKTFAGTTTITGDLEITGSAVAILFSGTASSSASLTFAGVLQTTPGSWGGTASAAANPNATWFGSSTTGVINILTSCLPGTWLGLTNTDWNTGSNWCGGSVPTATTDVSIGVNSNQPVIGVSGGVCRNLTIKTGATLTVSGSNSLTVKGNWTNNGTFTSNTSTVVFNGTAAQTIGGSSSTTFNTITNSNTTATISATIGMTVKNNLNITNSASILDLGTFVLTDGGTFSNTGLGKIKTANTSILPIPASKTWNSTVIYSGLTGGQTIVKGTYNGSPAIELDNTSGTQTASGNIITGGQLNINNGGTPLFDMNGYNLTTNALNVLAPNSILDMRGGVLTCTSVPSMDGTVRYSGTTNAKPFASGTVEYYGTTQTVTNGNYFNLLFTGASGVYTMTSDIDVANTLNITNGAVTLKDGYTLSVGDAVTVTNPATLTIENNASLLQTTYTGANTGNVIVKRNTTPVLKFDATFWSSPTTGTQTLYNFSPLTEWDRYNTYDSVHDVYVNEDATTTVFEKGKGYSIRCPANTSTTVPTVIPHQFVGVPNNGTFTIPVTTPPGEVGLSLIGNPYPSSLNVDDFINENLYDATLNPTNTLDGTYYFWSHNTRLTGNDFSSDDYYTCNLSGPTGYTNFGTGNNTLPTGFIASGQGFFVENIIAGDLKFNNSMRETKNNSNFYRTKKIKNSIDLERHRIWLNLTDSALTTGSQTMVGYIENATNGYDLGYDSTLFDDTRPLLIYSMLGTDIMAIQGRALPFSASDVVPIGYYTKIADNVTITMAQYDGLFLDDQGIYLEDKVLNIIHNLKEAPYTFASAAGTFNDRLVLRYTDGSLATKNFDAQTNKVLVSNKNKQIHIESFAGTIDKVAIYDLLGKQIYLKENIDGNELSIANIVSSHQTLVVKTTLQNGTTITNKIVY